MPGTLLADLPAEHPLRNMPLLAIGAENRWTGGPAGKGWKPVKPNWTIARRTYNELGPAWMANTEWRGGLPT